MATVISAPPSATSNSYITIEELKSYWELDIHKTNTWTDDELNIAVINATSQLDTEYGNRYCGTLYDATFALYFPRVGCSDGRGVSITDYDDYPMELKLSTSAQAYYALRQDRVSDDLIKISGVKKQEMEGLGSKEYHSVSQQRSATNINVIAQEVNDLIAPLLIGETSKYFSTLYRG